MGMKFDLKGVDELIQRLQKTQLEVVEKVAPRALKKAAGVVAIEARRRATLIDDPNSPESIAKNITVQKTGKRRTPQDTIKYRVGVKGGSKSYADTTENKRMGRVGKSYKTDGDKDNPGGDTWYWRLIEFGTVKMPAKPFMRPAIAAKEQEAAAVFISTFKKLLDKAVK